MLTAASNAHAGPSRLPPELLTMVFSILQKIWPPQRYQSTWDTPPYFGSGWMSILHVCATWRRVASGTPMLWQSVDVLHVHPGYAPQILASSGELGLRFFYQEHECAQAGVIQMPVGPELALSRALWFDAAALQRLETLRIVCNGPDEHLRGLLSQGAPNIRSLGMKSYGGHSVTEMLGTHFPHLYELSLNSCSIDCLSPLFAPTLTYLKLVNVVHHDHGSGTHQVLLALSHTPSLEYLHISMNPLWDEMGAPLQVSLPLLKIMILKMYRDDVHAEDLSAYVIFFQHLSLPPTARTVVNVDSDTNWNDPINQQIFPLILLSDPDDDLHVEIELASTTKWDLFAWNPASKARADRRRLDASPKDDEIPEYALFQLSKIILCTQPHSLAIRNDFWDALFDHTRNATLWNCISAASDVRCLTISYQDHHRLWLTLTRKPDLFPFLEAIVLQSVYLVWGKDEDKSDTKFEFEVGRPEARTCSVDTTMLADLFSSLAWAVGSMREAGVPLKEVEMEETTALAEWDGLETVKTLLDPLGLTLTILVSDDQ